MRCVGEIDITRPRWSERPTTLVPMILGNIKNFEPGAGARRFEQGRQEAWAKEQDVLERLRALPDGERKSEEAKRMIDRVRRSEEHTSELQSPCNLVCRLLLEKKKTSNV